jgi:hypothetical protein
MLIGIMLAAVLTAAPAADVSPDQIPRGGRNISAFSVDTTTTFQEVKAIVEQNLRRNKCKHAFEEYLMILDELADSQRYRVVTGRDFQQTTDPSKVIVYLRHDVDGDPFTALKMSEEEKKRGLSASYYFRPTSWYYGKQLPDGVARYACMDDLYRKIRDNGHEIGVHTDLFNAMLLWDIDPVVFQQQELKYYRENGFDVVGGVSNGSAMLAQLGKKMNRKFNNTYIFSEFGQSGSLVYRGKYYEYGKHALADFGFAYEGYRLGQNQSFSDIGGRKNGAEYVAKFRSFVPGDKVSFLTHPMHWGSRPEPAK